VCGCVRVLVAGRRALRERCAARETLADGNGSEDFLDLGNEVRGDDGGGDDGVAVLFATDDPLEPFQKANLDGRRGNGVRLDGFRHVLTFRRGFKGHTFKSVPHAFSPSLPSRVGEHLRTPWRQGWRAG
jgi:hypothetical protein